MSQIQSKRYRAIASLSAAVAFAVVVAASAVAQTPKAGEPPAGPATPREGAPLPTPPHGTKPGEQAKPAEPPKPAEPSKNPQQLGRKTPESPAERAKLLDDLYAHLATAPDEATAQPFSEAIERLWLASGSDTIAALMDRALQAVNNKRGDLALQLLSSVVELAPDYAEGWNRRAYVFYTEGDYERALGDLRRTLALDPNHYKALDGLGQIMRQLDRKQQALQTYERLQAVHPNWSNIDTLVEELRREVVGRGI